MARVAVQLTNFTGGELSPRLDGRNDLTKYASGCKTLENMIVYPHGSAARRPGTQFVAEVKDISPYLEAELFEIKFAQSADVMYICHPNHAVRKLSRTGHTAWTLTEVNFTNGPYLDNKYYSNNNDNFCTYCWSW
jgi:hypothetical protein